MTRYWDFRTILEVDPVNDQRCVAINKTTGKRCGIGGQWIGRSNLERAGKILDEMDRTESLSECRANLDELARVMVCGHPHRKSQGVLDDRVKRWNRTIATYVASRSRESVRPKVFPLVASSRDIVFGGRNEDLTFSFVGTPQQSQQTSMPDKFGHVPTSTRLLRSEDVSPVNRSVIFNSELVSETGTRSDDVATSEQAAIPDAIPPTLGDRFEFGAESQHNTQPWAFDFHKDFQQQDVEGPGSKSRGETTPNIAAHESIQRLAKLNIEAATLIFKDEVSPLESDYEPEQEALEVSPSLHSSEDAKSSTELQVEHLPQSQTGNEHEIATVPPEILNHSPTLLQKAKSFDEEIAQSNSDASEVLEVEQDFSSSEVSTSSGLSFSLKEESKLSSSNDVITTTQSDDDEPDEYKTEVVSLHEDLEKMHNSCLPTEEDRKPILSELNEKMPSTPPIAERSDLCSADIKSSDTTTSDAVQIVITTDNNDNIHEKRQTRSTTREILNATLTENHLSPSPNESYGHATVHETERRSSQRFSDCYTAPPVKSPLDTPYVINFSSQEHEVVLPPVKTNKKTIVKKEPPKQETKPKILDDVVRDEIAWENDRGIVKKPRGVRTSLKGLFRRL